MERAPKLHEFVPRAPRYAFNATDNRVIRFALDQDRQHTFASEVANVSESGIAFFMDRSLVPEIGELMKIEFHVPTKGQIAWFARITRIEMPDEHEWPGHAHQLLVATRFENLPEGHLHLLRLGLREQFAKAALRERVKSWQNFAQWLKKYGPKIALYLVSTLIFFLMMYYLTRPSPNYDPHHPTVWGERKFF